ncbi:MAG: hypothetical protein ABEI39_06520 [Halobacteriales archaeon]
MPDCRYCDASFPDEEAYHEHLRAEHEDELGPIDRRRIADDDAEESLSTGPIAIGLVLLVSVAVVGYVIFSGGSDSTAVARTPTAVGSVHYHGTINVTIAGERLDFSRDRYQLQAEAFHFERGDGERWHVHARSVTLEYAMASLGIDVAPDRIRFEGTTYSEADGATVVVEVDGESVDPASYVLREGDHVRIVVRP